jgi:hypothetical protein
MSNTSQQIVCLKNPAEKHQQYVISLINAYTFSTNGKQFCLHREQPQLTNTVGQCCASTSVYTSFVLFGAKGLTLRLDEFEL